MRAPILLFLLTLAACGDTGGNALTRTIFTTPDATAAGVAPVPAGQILRLATAPTSGGLIVSAVALPPTQGYWAAELRRIPSGDPATMAFAFQVVPPTARQVAGTAPTREVIGGTFLTNQDLAGIRTISVEGATNRQTVRR